MKNYKILRQDISTILKDLDPYKEHSPHEISPDVLKECVKPNQWSCSKSGW